MPREDWADYSESLDAFWADTPNVSAMDIGERMAWHRLSEHAEVREMGKLISSLRGKPV